MGVDPHFDGDDYVHERDFNRLMPQLQKVKQYMEENDWVTLSELSNATGAPEASASAALRDLRRRSLAFVLYQDDTKATDSMLTS